jgi:hypothetical protein
MKRIENGIQTNTDTKIERKGERDRNRDQDKYIISGYNIYLFR